ncbi:hypothetical protein Q3G72_007124 [Acer saccharum]|nr:hypothetical protein Q3G72_007124 [Acer saccharum]
MGTSEIVKLCEMLSLSDEGKVVRFQDEVRRDGIDDVSHCLVGKVLSGRKVNREAFISTDWVKPKPYRQPGKSSSDRGGSKSNSTSDGSTKGFRTSPRDCPQAQSVGLAGKGDLVEKLISRDEGTKILVDKSTELAKHVSICPVDSYIQTSTSFSDPLPETSVRAMAKEVGDASVIMEGVEAYSDGSVAFHQESSNQVRIVRDHSSTDTGNVRRWKRIARDSSHSHQAESGGQDSKRKMDAGPAEESIESKKMKVSLSLDNSLISAEPVEQARREP